MNEPTYEQLKGQLAAAQKACSEMRQHLEVIDKYQARFWPDHGTTSMAIKRALSTDCGRDYVPLSDLEEAYQKLTAEKEWSEDLAKQCCEMEDALGFKQDCHGPDGEFIPTMGPWKERVRDLIAKEGELETLKEQVKPLVEALRFIRCECDWETGDGRIMVACDRALHHTKEME